MDPDDDDLALRHVYDLAEWIASEVPLISPDWCGVVSASNELAALAQHWCDAASIDNEKGEAHD